MSSATHNVVIAVIVIIISIDVGIRDGDVMWPKLGKSAPTPARASACAYSTAAPIHQTTTTYHQSPPVHLPTHTLSLSLNKQPPTTNPKNVLPLRPRSPPALFRREDRSSRSRDRDGLQHVQPVRHSLPLPINYACASRSQKNLRTNMLSNNRLVDTCTKKCIPPQYREADLNKGESVCLDRCVSKFFEVNVKVSEKMQGEAQAKQGGGFA
jgi:hypothetical protein